MLKRIIKVSVCLLLILSNSVYSQKNESVLWEITGNGLKSKSYLFGTFHTVSIKLIDSFPDLKNIIGKCDFGIFEKSPHAIGEVIDIDIKTPPLDSVFTKTEYLLVDSFFTKSPFGSIKPHNNEASLLAMAQAVMMLNNKQTKDQDMFFDDYIQSYMIDSLKRKTFGLDEPLEMAESAKKTDNKRLAKLIVYLIESKVNLSASDKLFDEPLYIKTMQSDMKLSDEVKIQELKDGTINRNQIWLPKIITKTKEGSCFIAVGLGHLQYKTGIIALLLANGYTLRPIKLTRL